MAYKCLRVVCLMWACVPPSCDGLKMKPDTTSSSEESGTVISSLDGVDVFGIKDQKIVVRGVAINAKRMLLKLDSGELLEISHSDLDIGAWPMDIVGKSVVVQGNVGIRTQVVNEFGIPVDKSGRVVQGRSGSGPFVYLYD